MARVLCGEIKRALVVENPAIELDGLLESQGMEVTRLTAIPSEEELIKHEEYLKNNLKKNFF